MKDIKKIAGINLAVLLAYSAIIRLINGGGGTHGDEGLGILIMSAVAIALHVLVNLAMMVGCFATHEKELGWSWLLSAGLVLLVGFSTCWGNASF